MRSTVTNKSRRAQGFTLAETLVAMLLMGFVGLIVTGGIAMGARVYGRIVEKANAELLLSTTLTKIRDELDRVEEVSLEGNATAGYKLSRYRSSNTNWRSLKNHDKLTDNEKALLVDSKVVEGIYIVPDSGYIGSTTGGTPQLLVTEAAATDELYATFESISFQQENGDPITPSGVRTVKNGKFTVSGLKVYNKAGKELASTGTGTNADYTIRALESVRVYPSGVFQ